MKDLPAAMSDRFVQTTTAGLEPWRCALLQTRSGIFGHVPPDASGSENT